MTTTNTSNVQVITVTPAKTITPVPFVIGIDLHIIGVGDTHISVDELSTSTSRMELWDAKHNCTHLIPYALRGSTLAFQLGDTLVQLELSEVIHELMHGFSSPTFLAARKEFITFN